MSKGTLSPLFTWRGALTDEEYGAVPLPDSKVAAATMRHIGLTLSLHMGEKGDSCFPGLERLARESAYSKSTVTTALNELEATGWISRRKGGGSGNTTRYQATTPATVREAYRSRMETVRLAEENCPPGGQEDVKRTSVKKETSSPSQAPKRSDQVWDVLVELLDAPATPQEESRRAKCIKSILHAVFNEFGLDNIHEVAVREVRRRMAKYWEGLDRTDTALVNNWTLLGSRGYDNSVKRRQDDLRRRIAEHDAGKGD